MGDLLGSPSTTLFVKYIYCFREERPVLHRKTKHGSIDGKNEVCKNQEIGTYGLRGEERGQGSKKLPRPIL